jgi:hypothetical protein
MALYFILNLETLAGVEPATFPRGLFYRLNFMRRYLLQQA